MFQTKRENEINSTKDLGKTSYFPENESSDNTSNGEGKKEDDITEKKNDSNLKAQETKTGDSKSTSDSATLASSSITTNNDGTAVTKESTAKTNNDAQTSPLESSKTETPETNISKSEPSKETGGMTEENNINIDKKEPVTETDSKDGNLVENEETKLENLGAQESSGSASSTSPKKEKKEEEEKEEEDNSSKNVDSGAYYCVQGAMFSCDKSQAPIPAQIQVTQNQTLFAQNSLVITDKEVQFNPPAQPFGVCSLNPDTQGGKLCKYMNGMWDMTTCIKSKTANIITDKSEMHCYVFGDGKITSVTSGQKGSANSGDLASLETEVFDTPIKVEKKEEQEEKKEEEEPSIFGVKSIKYENTDSFGSGKVSEIKTINIRKNTVMTFSANPSDEVKNLIGTSWAIMEMKGKNVDKSTLQFKDQVGSPFSYGQFEKEKYLIEGIGNKPYANKKPNIYQKYKSIQEGKKNSPQPPFDFNCCFIINVTKNKISEILGPDFTTRADKIFTQNKKFYVEQNRLTIFKIKTDIDFDPNYDQIKIELSSGENPVTDFDPKFDAGKLTFEFTPINTETEYKFKVNLYEKLGETFSSIPISTYEFSAFCISDKIEMICEPNNEYVRPGTTILFKLALQHGNNPDLKKAIWKLNAVDINQSQQENTKLSEESSSDTSLNVDEEGNIVANENDVNAIIDELEKADLSVNEGKAASQTTSQAGTTPEQKQLTVWDKLIYTFNQEGTNTISVHYNGLRDISDANFSTHTVNVCKQRLARLMILSANSYFYTNVIYDMKFDYLYPDKDKSDDTIINYTISPASIDKELLTHHKLLFKKPGKYTIKSRLGNTPEVIQEIYVNESEVEEWGFFDTQDRPISIIGHGQTFCIKGSIPAWERITPKDAKNGPKSRHLSVKLICQKTCIWPKDKGGLDVSLDDNGNFTSDFLEVDKIIEANKNIFNGRSDRIVTFVVCNQPKIEVKGLSEAYGGVTMAKSILTFCNKFRIEGFFADDEGALLTDVIKYGDPVKVKLRMANITDQEAHEYRLRVYENEFGWDSCVFEKNLLESDDKLSDDKYIEIDIPTNQGDIQESQHEGEPGIPRHFYFRIETFKHKVIPVPFSVVPVIIPARTPVYTYPSKLVDYDYSLIANAKALRQEKSKSDNEQSSTVVEAKNYFYQLKIVKEEEENEYQKTVSALAPVLVGQKLKKTKRKTKCGDCECEKADLPWGEKLTCSERKKVIKICAQLWGEENKYEMARNLMICMAVESHLNPAAEYKGEESGACGLIQLTKIGATSVNDHIDRRMRQINKKIVGHETLTEEEEEITHIKKFENPDNTAQKNKMLKEMTLIQQLDYVKMYFDLPKYKKQTMDANDLYMAIFAPNKGIGLSMDTVLYDKKKEPENYEANESMDGEKYDEKSHKKIYGEKVGYVTKANACARVANDTYMGEFFKEKIFDCQGELNSPVFSDEICPICNKKHINVTDKSQFPGNNYQSMIQPDNTACCLTCKKIVTSGNPSISEVEGSPIWRQYSYKDFDTYRQNKPGDVVSGGLNYCYFQLALEDGRSLVFDEEKYQEALTYIDDELENGRAVVVGVNHHYRDDKPQTSRFYNDGVTDHFVVIIGRTCMRGKTVYIYWDVAGQVCKNRLYYFIQDHNGHYWNPHAWQNENEKTKNHDRTYKEYYLTQIRKNKVKKGKK